MRGKTTIIISHNPRLVRCADRVLVVDGRRIAEEGPTPAAAGGRAVRGADDAPVRGGRWASRTPEQEWRDEGRTPSARSSTA